MEAEGAEAADPTPSGVEKQYFDAYDVTIHELMLKDRPRTDAYLAALEALGPLEGKVVLDVGAGSGVLSLFAARLGARKVYAVEASPFAEMTRALVEQNGFGAVVEVLHARVEDVELPERADVLVSEWMGFGLLHENMLESVLSARDRLLRPGGIMLPRAAEMWAAPASLEAVRAERVGFWSDVYGFDFSPCAPLAVAAATRESLVRLVPPGEVLAEPQLLARFDLASVAAADLKVVYRDLGFEASRAGTLGGLCLWFAVEFEGQAAGRPPVVLSTAPSAPPTHWKQTSVMLPEPLRVEAAGDPVRFAVTVAADPENERMYDFSVDLLPCGGVGGGGGDDDDGKGGEAEITFGDHPPSCDCLQCVLVRAATREYDAAAAGASDMDR